MSRPTAALDTTASSPTRGLEPLPSAPVAHAPAQARGGTFQAPAQKRSPWWMELMVIAWLAWVYDLITGLAPLRQAAALSHAWGVLHLERSLHLDPELTLNRWLSHHHSLGLALSDYYDNAHFIVTLAVLGWLWWWRPGQYRPLRNALVLINVIGFIVFWLYPTAPPRMLSGVGFTDVVALTHAFGSWHTGTLASNADQLAAMPSLHIAWAAWCVFAVWKVTERRWVRALVLVHLGMTCFAVLATGNHFLADVLAGFATTVLSVCCVRVATAQQLGTRLLRMLGRERLQT